MTLKEFIDRFYPAPLHFEALIDDINNSYQQPCACEQQCYVHASQEACEHGGRQVGELLAKKEPFA